MRSIGCEDEEGAELCIESSPSPPPSMQLDACLILDVLGGVQRSDKGMYDTQRGCLIFICIFSPFTYSFFQFMVSLAKPSVARVIGAKIYNMIIE
jgi:hypothetical protein